jgi:hypothetical protein
VAAIIAPAAGGCKWPRQTEMAGSTLQERQLDICAGRSLRQKIK